MDKIYIRDLSLQCIIGIYPKERRAKQEVVINIVLRGNYKKAARTDSIRDAVNYKTIKNKVVAHVWGSRYKLIETMAERIAAICLEDRAVKRVEVTVDKPGALRFARSVAVEITRSR